MEAIIERLKEKQFKLFGSDLTEEETLLFDSEQRLKSIGNIRIANILFVAVIIIFSIMDLFTITNQSTLINITIARIIFLSAFILPLHFISKSKFYIKHFTTISFFNILIYIVFIHVIAWFYSNNLTALLNLYISLLLIILIMNLLLGISISSSITLSIISILLSNFIIISQHLIHYISIPIFQINLWFFIVLLLALTFGLYFEALSKNAFLMQLKLKEENSLKNKFFSVVAHDLKNMIASQYSIAEFLSQNNETITATKLDEMLKILIQSASNVMEVFEDLMHWIKAQLETVIIHNKKTSLKKLLTTVTDLMIPAAHNKQITISTNHFEDFNIITDANLLGMVVRNLIGNAIKFSEKDTCINLHVECQANVTELQITDHGIGMKQKQIEQIFNLERIESTPGTNGETGTGLGLILSKELMTVLKGELIIESYWGKGTTITLLIPNS